MRAIATFCLAAIALIAMSGAASAAPALVTTNLNVRAAPTTGSPIIGSLPGGTTVDALNCNFGWCEAAGGYVAEMYLDFDAVGYGYSSPGYNDYPSYDYGYVPYDPYPLVQPYPRYRYYDRYDRYDRYRDRDWDYGHRHYDRDRYDHYDRDRYDRDRYRSGSHRDYDRDRHRSGGYDRDRHKSSGNKSSNKKPAAKKSTNKKPAQKNQKKGTTPEALRGRAAAEGRAKPPKPAHGQAGTGKRDGNRPIPGFQPAR
ncbi:SH3 domain-containing protein [Methyloligella solikamskensis]|uniref:SH3 domain-containing protein n=1 Tax=Methyloligella solikamskensis TaxID=1177756 RepID=A0ABW3JCW0_9HYPH